LGPEDAKVETERVAKLLSDAQAILETITVRRKELEDQVAASREAQRLRTLEALEKKDEGLAAGVLAAKLAEQGVGELPSQGATQEAAQPFGPAGAKRPASRKRVEDMSDQESTNPAKFYCIAGEGDEE
jgi:hypothetical protein